MSRGVQVLDRPAVAEPIVVPEFSTPQEAWRWLKEQARLQGKAGLIHQVKERGSCDSQTRTKVKELSGLLGIPITL
ncbi:MAG: hypothetical protein QXW38_08455 [Candidatus Nitrosotenuis sp.]